MNSRREDKHLGAARSSARVAQDRAAITLLLPLHIPTFSPPACKRHRTLYELGINIPPQTPRCHCMLLVQATPDPCSQCLQPLDCSTTRVEVPAYKSGNI